MIMQNSNRAIEHSSRTSKAFDTFSEERRQNLVGLLRRIPSVVGFAQELEGVVSGDKYKVVIPPELLQRLKDGSARLGKSGTGGLSANIHDSQFGEIIGQIGLAEAPPELISSLNQMAIQSALADVAERLEVIEQKIDEVLQGQEDDRKGLVDSAENLYIMASAASEAENRRLLLANAVAQLSEARGQMIRSLESSINSVSKIPTGKWGIIRSSLLSNKDIPKDVQRKSEILEATFREVLRASCLMALSCGQLGESVSLRESWQPLERFMPQISEVQAKVARWLPNQPNALPDKLSTLVSTTDEVIQAGKQLESGTVRPLEIELMSDELTNGEGNS